MQLCPPPVISANCIYANEFPANQEEHMSQDNQHAAPEEVAGGYGTPTVEQEMGGSKQFAQPREEEDFDAAGLNENSPDGETFGTGAPEPQPLATKRTRTAPANPGQAALAELTSSSTRRVTAAGPGFDPDSRGVAGSPRPGAPRDRSARCRLRTPKSTRAMRMSRTPASSPRNRARRPPACRTAAATICRRKSHRMTRTRRSTPDNPSSSAAEPHFCTALKPARPWRPGIPGRRGPAGTENGAEVPAAEPRKPGLPLLRKTAWRPR